MHICLEVKWADCWVGVFWRRTKVLGYWKWDVWVCLLPCVPLHLWWLRPRPKRHFDWV